MGDSRLEQRSKEISRTFTSTWGQLRSREVNVIILLLSVNIRGIKYQVSVTVTPCHSVCHSVTVSVTVTPCHGDTVSQCPLSPLPLPSTPSPPLGLPLILSIISIISVMECIFFYFLVAPSLVSWLGLWCRGSLHTTPPPPPLAATTCHHQNSCLLHISACNGLTKLTRLTPQQQQSAMWSFRNIFTRRNIKIQIYSSHSIHVLVLNGSTDIVRHFRDWYKSRLQYKCVKRTAVALSSHWHVKLEWA